MTPLNSHGRRAPRWSPRTISMLAVAGLVAALMLAACSDDDSAVAESGARENLESAVGDALEGVEAPDGDSRREGDTIINVGGQDDAAPETTEELPTWAWVLIAVVAVVAVVGLIVGLQNRNARQNEEATQQAIRDAQQQSYQHPPPPPPPAPSASAEAVPPPQPATPEPPAPDQI